MKKEKIVPLLVGVVVLALGLGIAISAHQTTYQESLAISTEIKNISATLSEIEAGTDTESNKEQLESQKSKLSDEKLAKERPYSYGLTITFLGFLLLVKGLVTLLDKKEEKRKMTTLQIALSGLMAALCYIGFAFFKIDIPVGATKTAFHLGNVFVVLGALLLGGYYGGLAGAIGLTLADLTTAYVTSAPKTFILKLMIGLIVGLFAHKIFHINGKHSSKKVVIFTVLSAIAGMAFNVVADPLVGYIYKTYILGIPQDLAKALTKIAEITTSVNAVIAVAVASLFYLALRPALKKTGLLDTEETAK